jgi:hypothetical protein
MMLLLAAAINPYNTPYTFQLKKIIGIVNHSSCTATTTPPHTPTPTNLKHKYCMDRNCFSAAAAAAVVAMSAEKKPAADHHHHRCCRRLQPPPQPHDFRRCQSCFVMVHKRIAKTCGRCGNVRYCSPSCQATDWRAFHKQSCRPDNRLERDNTLIPTQTNLIGQMQAVITMKHLTKGVQEPSCMVCADVAAQCQLKKTRVGIMCTDCIAFQLKT